jgi:3-dehydroquinate dehydratase/shikimate dehydrogenase
MLVGSVTHPHQIDQIRPLVDLIELRLDYFEIHEKPDFPVIFTLRKKEQGGVYDFSESTRLKKIEKLLELGPDYCDIEADTDPVFIERIAKKFPKVKLIGSYHNFEETPQDLDAIFQTMKNPHFSIYKMALQACSTLDMLKLMIFLKKSKEPLSAMSMGELGKPSRVMAPILGSVLDYAGLEEDPKLHRYSLKTLLETFHYKKLNRQTLLYSLIGNPVEQSPGHLFHNLRFQHNAVYIKMSLLGEEVPEFFALLRQLPFGGLSITIPLKEAVYSQMDEVKPIAQVIGAINTVLIQNRKIIGTNTDGPGALNAIEKHLKVRGKRIAILGAGGTARAIAYEAKKRGALVMIFNRTPERARKLADEFGCVGYVLDALSQHSYDILVNTIPPKESQVPPLHPYAAVMDAVYTPKETPLLAAAKELGCLCIYGEEMFVEQALLQQKEWSVAKNQ